MPEPKTIQWWKNGDHPKDKSTEVPLEERTAGMVSFLTEGEVVRFVGTDSHNICGDCGAPARIHGEVGGTLVHPGDFVSVNRTKTGYTVTRPDPLAAAAALMEATGVDLNEQADA